MKKSGLAILFILVAGAVEAQYTKEKLIGILTSNAMKTWSVEGMNTDRPEKSMTFSSDNTCKIEFTSAPAQNVKWSLKSGDNIRWFLLIGPTDYELIVSYDKKGDQYIKLTHQAEEKSSRYYEIKLYQPK